jgi:hypothetical protein
VDKLEKVMKYLTNITLALTGLLNNTSNTTSGAGLQVKHNKSVIQVFVKRTIFPLRAVER